MTAVAGTLVCASAVAVLLGAEHGRYQDVDPSTTARFTRVARVAKLAAAAGFLLVGWGAAPFLEQPYAAWICAGLGFGALGDAALLGTSRTSFVAGMALFALGHASYLVAVSRLVAVEHWFQVESALPVAAVAAICLVRMWPRLGSYRTPVLIYVGFVAATAIAAWAPLLTGQPPWFGSRAALLAVGATLFFLSDIAVARQRFLTRSFANKLVGLPLYFAGQLLIAWSAVA